jgi:hypothetical protein
LEELLRRNVTRIKPIHDSLLKVEEIREDFLRISDLFFPGESGEFFCNLVMVERKNDIAQIVKDDFNGRLGHLSPSPHPLPREAVS